MADPDSVFSYYQKLIVLRKQYPVFVEGDFTLHEADHPRLFVYERALGEEKLLVVCNFGDEKTPWTLPGGWRDAETLIENCPPKAGALQPWEARILRRA